MDNGTAILMIKALDCLSARSVVTAQNIANAGTPNYRPLRLKFEQALADAAIKGDDAVQQVSPQITADPQGTSNGEMRLDLEMQTASATALRYTALIDVLGRQLQMNSLAITGTT